MVLPASLSGPQQHRRQSAFLGCDRTLRVCRWLPGIPARWSAGRVVEIESRSASIMATRSLGHESDPDGSQPFTGRRLRSMTMNRRAPSTWRSGYVAVLGADAPSLLVSISCSTSSRNSDQFRCFRPVRSTSPTASYLNFRSANGRPASA